MWDGGGVISRVDWGFEEFGTCKASFYEVVRIVL